MSNGHTPWKIGAMESGRVAIDDAQDRQVTGWLESEDAERILKAVNAHDDLLEALERLYSLAAEQLGDDYTSVTKAAKAIAKARGTPC